MLPSILDQFIIHSTETPNVDVEQYANVGTGRISNHSPYMKSVVTGAKKGPLYIHEKRWYFRLVSKKSEEYSRARALMDDYELNQLAHHLVICFMPDHIPGQTVPFRNRNGDPIRLYAFFESYLEFYQYMLKFEPTERSFFEIIFGELPQKPHFDIDISQDKITEYYPSENIDTVSELLREAVILGCIQVAADLHVTIDIERDILIYSSHGANKRSWHILITNKCHDSNKEAKAFYDAVMTKVTVLTRGKYIKETFIDAAVYSPRQQFRMIGSQKLGSGRPKIFCEEFILSGIKYRHIYNEDVSDPQMKKLVVIYESLIGFTTGCMYLPSLIPERPGNQYNLADMPDLESGVVEQCMKMLRDKVKDCPFTVRQVQGSLIMLARKAPSHCPICNTIHHAENPYIRVSWGKVYWDCRRATGKTDKLFLGYLAMTMEELMTANMINIADSEEDDGEYEAITMFGDFQLSQPTGVTSDNISTVISQPVTKSEAPVSVAPVNMPVIPIEQRTQNIQNVTQDMVRKRAAEKYIRSQPEDLTGVRSLSSAFAELAWNAGL